MTHNDNFPVILTPEFLVYAENIGKRTNVRPASIRLTFDRGDLRLAFKPVYDSNQDLLYQTDGVQIFVNRELAPKIAGWTLDLVASIDQGDVYSAERPGPDSTASNPGRLKLDRDLLLLAQPELAGKSGEQLKEKDLRFHTSSYDGTFKAVADHIRTGDTRAAVVIQTRPNLLVAAYSDDLDCVAVLRFPLALVDKFQLYDGARLLTCNWYGCNPNGLVLDDLKPSPAGSGHWTNFHPVIAQFVSSDTSRLQELAQSICEAEWDLTARYGQEWLQRAKKRKAQPRIGSPIWASRSASDPPLVDAPIRLRAVAAVLDLVMITLVVATVFWCCFGFDQVVKSYLANPGMNGAPRADFRAMGGQVRNWATIAFLIYAMFMTASPWKATMGKLLFGMRVIDANSKKRVGLLDAAKRTSGMLIGAMFAMKEISESGSGQAWHDKIAGSRVVKIHRPTP